MYFWSNISESKADYAKCACVQCVIWPSSEYKYAQQCCWCQTGSRLLNIWWSRFKPMGISWVQSNTRGLHNPQQRSWKKFTRFFSTPRLHTQTQGKKEETFKIFCTWLLHSHLYCPIIFLIMFIISCLCIWPQDISIRSFKSFISLPLHVHGFNFMADRRVFIQKVLSDNWP